MKKIMVLLLIGSFIYNADADARQPRSQKAKNIFKVMHPCPSTGQSKGRCEGYVIDHIKPLACGGEDLPSNMQWQTVQEGKAKDKWERKNCELNN